MVFKFLVDLVKLVWCCCISAALKRLNVYEAYGLFCLYCLFSGFSSGDTSYETAQSVTSFLHECPIVSTALQWAQLPDDWIVQAILRLAPLILFAVFLLVKMVYMTTFLLADRPDKLNDLKTLVKEASKSLVEDGFKGQRDAADE